MKTAVLISGQLRASEQCVESIKRHLLGKLPEYDIFAQIADDADAHKISLFGNATTEVADPPLLDEKNYIHRSGRLAHNVQRVLIMMWRMQQGNLLKKAAEKRNGKRYDWIIRLRADTEFFSDIEDLQSMNPNAIYLPTFGNYWGYNDRFAFGGSAEMDVYLDKLFEPLDRHIANGGIFHPESILKGVIDEAGIEVRRTNVIFDTVRNSGDRVRPAWEPFFGDILPDWMKNLTAERHGCLPSQIGSAPFGLPFPAPVLDATPAAAPADHFPDRRT